MYPVFLGLEAEDGVGVPDGKLILCHTETPWH